MDLVQTKASNFPSGISIEQHFYSLDLARYAMLTLGVAVHAANIDNSSAFFVIKFASSMFRMNAFFFISGILAAITILKLDNPTQWLRKRIAALMIPFIFGVLILNPLCLLAYENLDQVSGFMNGFASRNTFDWHLHLWFLPVLVCYCFVFCIGRSYINHRAQTKVTIDNVIFNISSNLLMFITTLCATGLFLTLVKLFLSRTPFLFFSPIKFIVVNIISHAPDFFLGIILVHHRHVYAQLKTSKVMAFAFISATCLLFLYFFIPSENFNNTFLNQHKWTFEFILSSLARYSTSLFAFCIISRIIYSDHKPPNWLVQASTASYTVYVLHLIVVHPSLYLLSTAGWNKYVAFVTVFAVATIMLTLFHVKVVQNSRTWKLLLNGRGSLDLRAHFHRTTPHS